MKAFITFAFLSLAALPGFLVAQVQPVNPKFSLKLSERKPENYKGKHIWLVIEMTNTSDQVLDCSSFVETNTHDHGFGGWRTLAPPTKGGCPILRLFSGEGWAGINLAHRNGRRMFPSWRSLFATSSAAVFTL